MACLLLAACAAESGTPPPGAPAEQVSGVEAVCLQGEPFVADGRLPLEPRSAARGGAIQGLRWQSHEVCERFVIDLVDRGDGGAGGVGEVRAEVVREQGLVRVRLPGVERVEPEATEGRWDGELAGAAYVVRAPDGRGLMVDLHLAAPAEAHATWLQDPSRIVVDLRPGGGPLPSPAPTGPRVVVLEPRGGAASFPLRVEGYARTFEANVVVRLEQAGETAHETFTTATDYVETWGHFALEVDDGPAGPVELHVGEYSARDGAWEGAVLHLEIDR